MTKDGGLTVTGDREFRITGDREFAMTKKEARVSPIV